MNGKLWTMKKELEYFKIGGSYGGNQDWFLDVMMRIGGCGAVTACDCCIYFARHRNKAHLYPFDANRVTKRDYLKFAKMMKPYLRPRKGGINTLQLYIDGFFEYLKCVKEDRLTLLPLSGDLPYEEAACAVKNQVDQGYPVPCLTLHHSKPEMSDYVWHWFLLTGYDMENVSINSGGPNFLTGDAKRQNSQSEDAEGSGLWAAPTDGMRVKAVTYGEYRWLDLQELWRTGYEEKGGLILFSDGSRIETKSRF